jgi:hypothetical protein
LEKNDGESLPSIQTRPGVAPEARAHNGPSRRDCQRHAALQVPCGAGSGPAGAAASDRLPWDGLNPGGRDWILSYRKFCDMINIVPEGPGIPGRAAGMQGLHPRCAVPSVRRGAGWIVKRRYPLGMKRDSMPVHEHAAARGWNRDRR